MTETKDEKEECRAMKALRSCQSKLAETHKAMLDMHIERDAAWLKLVATQKAEDETGAKLAAERYARGFAEAQVEALTKEYSDAMAILKKERDDLRRQLEAVGRKA